MKTKTTLIPASPTGSSTVDQEKQMLFHAIREFGRDRFRSDVAMELAAYLILYSQSTSAEESVYEIGNSTVTVRADLSEAGPLWPVRLDDRWI